MPWRVNPGGQREAIELPGRLVKEGSIKLIIIIKNWETLME
jgi:hypothetical protein